MKLPGKLLGISFLCLYAVVSDSQVTDNIETGNSGLDLVSVQGGWISGGVNSEGKVHYYQGIPFAAPPVGKLRWRAPQPVIPWKGVRRCDSFAASPMQETPVPFGPWTAEYLIPKNPISEDCLYLNVWTAAVSPAEKRPVLVWIYGGGFLSGGSGVPVYDGTALAKKGIVFVSINYRVGIFGFFSFPGLSSESKHHSSGNYGLLDQIAALKWVRKNIAAFGGNPDNITIAGQSAGSVSVNCLVASPLANHLFQHAIAESGAQILNTGSGFATLSQAEKTGSQFAASLKVYTLEQLRGLPAETLLKQQRALHIDPIIDGYVLPESLTEIFAKGKQNQVPLLTGWNEDDAVEFGAPASAEKFRQEAAKRFGAEAASYLKFYPASTDSETAVSAHRSARDIIFGVQNGTWANIQSASGKSKVYVYYFTRRVPARGRYIRFGAFHTGEVAYALDNLSFLNNRPLEQADFHLEDIMSDYWIRFIRSGDPNGSGLPNWPNYLPDEGKVMLLDTKVAAGNLPDKAALDFLYTFFSTPHTDKMSANEK